MARGDWLFHLDVQINSATNITQNVIFRTSCHHLCKVKMIMMNSAIRDQKKLSSDRLSFSQRSD
jgi:hypothetical protein